MKAMMSDNLKQILHDPEDLLEFSKQLALYHNQQLTDGENDEDESDC
jgi:hypothetical protein